MAIDAPPPFLKPTDRGGYVMATIETALRSTNDFVAPPLTKVGAGVPATSLPNGRLLPDGTTRDKYGNYVGPDGKIIADSKGNLQALPGASSGLATALGTRGAGDAGLDAALSTTRPIGAARPTIPLGMVSRTPVGDPTKATATLTGPIERIGNQAPITAREIQAAQIGQYQGAQNIGPIQAGISTAGTSVAGQIQGTSLAQRQAAINAERVSAALAASPEKIASERIQAVQAQQQDKILAERVSAAQAGRTVLGPTSLADETQLGPTALADQTDIDMSKQAEFREGQQGLISGLQGAISGKDPSVAAIMLRQQADRNIANQFALAQSARGGNVGMSQRTAAINAANIGQTLAGQQALLRAKEITDARGQMGSVLDSARGADVSLATKQADLAQQVKLANAGFTNTANMTQAQLSQAVKLANAGFKNTANTTQAQLDQATTALNTTQMNSVNTSNADRSMDASKTNASLAQQIALSNQAAENTARTNNANNNLDAAKANLVAAQQTALANQSAENVARLDNAKNALTAAQKNADLAQAVELKNQEALNNTSEKNAGFQNTTNIANANNVTSASNQTSVNQTSANNTTAIQNADTARANALNQLNSNTSQAKLTQEASTTNAANSLDASKATATNNQAVALANALAANTADNRNADRSTDVSKGNAVNQVNTNAQGITSTQNAASNALREKEIAIQAAAEKRAADAQAWNQKKDVATAVTKGLSSLPDVSINTKSNPGGTQSAGSGPDPLSNGRDYGAGVEVPGPVSGGPQPGSAEATVPGSPGDDEPPTSDRRAKKNVHRADSDIAELLKTIKPYGYRYKDPKAPGSAAGPQFGPMAQDLEKSKAGKSLVHNTASGKKVDPNHGLLTALAALGNIDKRLKKIEGRSA